MLTDLKNVHSFQKWYAILRLVRTFEECLRHSRTVKNFMNVKESLQISWMM